MFTLEYGLNIDDNSGVGNTGGLNARQQFVGLSSARLGTLALGRQYAPGFDATANNDALEATDMSIQSSLSALAGDTITPNSNARFDNAITYTSNNMAGFTVKAIYGFGESKVCLLYTSAPCTLAHRGRTRAPPRSRHEPPQRTRICPECLGTTKMSPPCCALPDCCPAASMPGR